MVRFHRRSYLKTNLQEFVPQLCEFRRRRQMRLSAFEGVRGLNPKLVEDIELGLRQLGWQHLLVLCKMYNIYIKITLEE